VHDDDDNVYIFWWLALSPLSGRKQGYLLSKNGDRTGLEGRTHILSEGQGIAGL
jgi:hypothetical protein